MAGSIVCGGLKTDPVVVKSVGLAELFGDPVCFFLILGVGDEGAGLVGEFESFVALDGVYPDFFEFHGWYSCRG
jgi:hypothetical protein